MEPRPSTISEIEFELQQALASLREIDQRGDLPRELKPLLQLAPPDGASIHVSLRHRDTGRPLRHGSPGQSWASQACGAWIFYETSAGPSSGGAPPARAIDGSGNPLRDFVVALDHVEKDPHLRFVSLKWFRDTYLPKRGYEWAGDPDIPRQMVHEAAESEMILTSKVPNPKTPEFPVTTIRLNREHPRVSEFLAGSADDAAARTRPTELGSSSRTDEFDSEPTGRRPRRRGPAGEEPREPALEA